MRILLISSFTLAMYLGAAEAQPPATEPAPASTQEADNAQARASDRNHARAAQRMARSRRAAEQDNDAPRSGGLPLSETVVSQAPRDPDPDR